MSTGGQQQQQSGYQSGNFAGNTAGLNVGAQTGATSATGQSTGATTGQTTGATTGNTTNASTSTTGVNVPAANQSYYDRAGANIGPDGLTDAQRQAQKFMGDQMGQGTVSAQYSINDLNNLKPGYNNLATATATPINSSNAAASTGASLMQPYQAGYTNDVVNSTLRNYDQNTADTLAGMQAQRGRGSAFGDRSQLADATYRAKSDLGRGQLASSLLDTGFTRAADLGQQDAGRLTQNNQFNATQNNSVGQANAANDLAAKGLNLNALNSAGQNAINTSQLAQQGTRLNADLANNYFNSGTTGQGQNLNLFTAGNSLLGNTTSNTGSQNTNMNTQQNSQQNTQQNSQQNTQSDSANVGGSVGVTSGNSSGYNSGQSSGKSQGISL
jgi:hypothetical protein